MNPHFCFLMVLLSFQTACAGAGPSEIEQDAALGDGSALDGGSGHLDARVPPSESTTMLELHLIRDAEARDAVCNLGTAASYYFRRSATGSTRWIIFLKGGGFGVNATAVERRQMSELALVTSEGLPTTMEGSGILSLDSEVNADFHDVNAVYVNYCSSDVWSGDRAASTETGGYHFRGKRIVDALVADLANSEIIGSPNLADATEVILGGGSAGGAGVVANLDRVAAAIPHANVRGLCDAGWMLDVPSFKVAQPSLAENLVTGRDFWSAHVDDSCESARSAEPGDCYIGPVVYPFLSTPLFVNLSQQDHVQLGLNNAPDEGEVRNETEAADREAYVAMFAAAARASLATVPGCFSANDTMHVASGDSNFSGRVIDGNSVASVLGNWYFDRDGMQHFIEEP